MAVPEFEAHGRQHRSLEFRMSDEELGIVENPSTSYPTLEDIEDSKTAKYAIAGVVSLMGLIGVVAAKHLYDKRKEP